MLIRYGLFSVLLDRVGLMGNPSDGFNGKTIAMSISNFWAEVTLVESETLVYDARTHARTQAQTCAHVHKQTDRDTHTHTF